MKKIKKFFDEVVVELRRIVWPSPEKVADNTKIVVISTVVLAAFFGLIDFILVAGINLVF